MGISSSMNAGVSGLNANAAKLSTISDNISNSETYGYKRSDVDFASMTVNDISSPAARGGGTGFSAGGVATNAVWEVDEKGAMVSSRNATDIAVAGRGLIPVTTIASVGANNDSLPLVFTTTGSFKTDADGYLATPSGMVMMGWPAAADGSIPPQPRTTASGLEPVKINFASVASLPTNNVILNANLPATETQAGAGGDTLPVTVEYFDNLGSSQTLDISFTPSVPAAGSPQTNTWTMEITDQASGLSAGTYDLVFDNAAATAGQLMSVTQTAAGTPPLSTTYDPVTGEIDLALGLQNVAVSLGSTDPNGPQHVSQLSSVFSPQGVTRDGNPAGTYTGVTIDQNGLLSATYSTGFTRVLYQVPLADVPNLNGMHVLDNQTFAVSEESGAMYLWDAGAGPTGGIQGYAREQSTTDTAQELTALIRTQRAYSSNAKIIQTVDEMLQETTNLKR